MNRIVTWFSSLIAAATAVYILCCVRTHALSSNDMSGLKELIFECGEYSDWWRSFFCGIDVECWDFIDFDPCSLQVIDCSPDSERILGLHLSSQNMSCTFPEGIRNMTELQVLDLSGNSITGYVPDWVGTDLSLLQIINLEKNQLTGFIPKSFESLDSLVQLKLGGNQLQGGSHCICSLSSLSIVDISSNLLSELLPDCLNSSDLPLAVIRLSNNQLFGEMTKSIQAFNLVELDLSSNEIYGLLPTEVPASLNKLDLSNNLLTGQVSPLLMSSIEDLFVFGNNFDCPLPDGLVGCDTLSCCSCRAGFVGNSSSDCTLCPVGTFSATDWSTECSECLGGEFNAVAGATRCSACPQGSVSISSRTDCLFCGIGTEPSADNTFCIPCPDGFFKSENMTECLECPPGTASDIDLKQCIQCNQGTFRNGKLPYCIPCPLDEESNDDFSSCTPCQEGYYRHAFMESCMLCTESNESCTGEYTLETETPSEQPTEESTLGVDPQATPLETFLAEDQETETPSETPSAEASESPSETPVQVENTETAAPTQAPTEVASPTEMYEESASPLPTSTPPENTETMGPLPTTSATPNPTSPAEAESLSTSETDCATDEYYSSDDSLCLKCPTVSIRIHTKECGTSVASVLILVISTLAAAGIITGLIIWIVKRRRSQSAVGSAPTADTQFSAPLQDDETRNPVTYDLGITQTYESTPAVNQNTEQLRNVYGDTGYYPTYNGSAPHPLPSDFV